MRELKFRVYIPDHEKFCYFTLGNFDYSDRYLHQHSYPVQQYTGLKDKNGKEIYEGDILKVKITDEVIPSNNERKINAHVRWHNICARWIVEGKLSCGETYSFGSDENCYIDHLSPDSIDAKIIGNIFENPELLK